MLETENCKICQSSTVSLFSAKQLRKYEARYYKCTKCGFIQTEEPYWLHESYSTAITSLDIGLVGRNIHFSGISEQIFKYYFNYERLFLDYAGGYGLFVRLMRDKGFNFYRQDAYCENIFAKYFDLDDLPKGSSFEAITAFEVFEHLQNPLDEISKLFLYADTILFSTELLPDHKLESVNDWWYFLPEIGQHIAFYSWQTLNTIASTFNCYLYSNNNNLHLFTKRKFTSNPFDSRNIFLRKVSNKINVFLRKKQSIKLQSLRNNDFKFIKEKTSI